MGWEGGANNINLNQPPNFSRSENFQIQNSVRRLENEEKNLAFQAYLGFKTMKLIELR